MPRKKRSIAAKKKQRAANAKPHAKGRHVSNTSATPFYNNRGGSGRATGARVLLTETTVSIPFYICQIASRLGLVGNFCQIGGGDGKGLLAALSGRKRPAFNLKPVAEEGGASGGTALASSLFNPQAVSPDCGRPKLQSRKSARFSTPEGYERPQLGVAVTVTTNPVDGRPTTTVRYRSRKESGIQRLVSTGAGWLCY